MHDGPLLTLDDLAGASEIGDWKMPDFKAACAYAVSQGWLIVEDDVLTLTAARAGWGLRRPCSERSLDFIWMKKVTGWRSWNAAIINTCAMIRHTWNVPG